MTSILPENATETPRPKRAESHDETEAESVAGQEGGGAELPAANDKQTYISIDGMDGDELPQEDIDIIEKRLTDFFLTGGYPIEGVRVITEREVVEYEPQD